MCAIYISEFFVIITKYFILLLLQNNFVFVDKYLPTASKQFVPIEYYLIPLQNDLCTLIDKYCIGGEIQNIKHEKCLIPTGYNFSVYNM